MPIPILTNPDLAQLNAHLHRQHSPYKAMYSSLWEAITTDQRAMMLPIDDHLVHRGDGVFEAFRSYENVIYDLDAHLKRLEFSADGIELRLPKNTNKIKEICIELGRASQCKNATFRLYVSRGPGGFTTNPYECIAPQLYIVVTETKPYALELYQKGVSVGLSRFRTKELPFCQIKNCNYLINVLMKKEAIDQKLDFTVALDPNGNVAESSTENIALLTKDNKFKAPKFDYKLKGTTLLRCMDLANTHRQELGITSVSQESLSLEDFKNAKEIMMIGTTMGVLPVSTFAEVKLQMATNSSFASRLYTLLQNDIATNEARRDHY